MATVNGRGCFIRAAAHRHCGLDLDPGCLSVASPARIHSELNPVIRLVLTVCACRQHEDYAYAIRIYVGPVPSLRPPPAYGGRDNVEVRNWWIRAETKEKRPGPIEALVLLPPRWIHADLGWVRFIGAVAGWLP